MSLCDISEETVTPFHEFSRAEWSALRADTPNPLSEQELATLRSFNEDVDLEEITHIYLPLARLLKLYINSTRSLSQVTAEFLGHAPAIVPYVIGVVGSVAVGKSTTARVLQALLARGPERLSVDLVTTDGFLYPNATLAAHNLMQRKGFPESYDVRRLVHFVADVKSGASLVTAPIYSHLHYDIVPDQTQLVAQPDVLIIEGLNLLQSTADYPAETPRAFVSDFFDFSIYVDAEEADLESWYVRRFLRLRETAFRNPESYFIRYSSLSEDEATAVARQIWHSINKVNLHRNILPTRERARLILEKGSSHAVERVRLRKI